VAMMQAAEPGNRNDSVTIRQRHSIAGRPLGQTKVSSILVIIADILGEKPFQVPFVDRDHVIEQIAPATFNPALGYAVLPRTLLRRSDRGDPQRSDSWRNLRSIFAIAVEDQKPRSRVQGKGFPQLLNDPCARRMLRNIEVQNMPPVMANDEKAIERAERKGRYREEVHRGNRFPMIAEKREPAFSRFRISRRSPHPAGNRAFRIIKPEQKQLTMNARRAPSRILRKHPEDQFSHLLRCLPTPEGRSGPGDHFPVQTKTSPVPPDHRLRRDDNEGLFPSGPEPFCQDPADLIENGEPWPGMPALQRCELLTESEIFEKQATTSAEQPKDRSE